MTDTRKRAIELAKALRLEEIPGSLEARIEAFTIELKAAYTAGWDEGIEAAKNVVNAEVELPDKMPEDVQYIPLDQLVRAIVVATKNSIAKNMRALKRGEGGKK